MSPWEEDENIIAGRDVKDGGTWFGFNKKTKNIAFLTNRSTFKSKFCPCFLGKKLKSRGHLIWDYLKTKEFDFDDK